VFADLEDLDDVGVLQPGDRRRLAAEQGQGVLAGQLPAEDHLDGDDA
jgi:hypothetical protein